MEGTFVRTTALASNFIGHLKDSPDVHPDISKLRTKFEAVEAEGNVGLHLLAEDLTRLDGPVGVGKAFRPDKILLSALRNYRSDIHLGWVFSEYSTIISDGVEYASSHHRASGSYALLRSASPLYQPVDAVRIARIIHSHCPEQPLIPSSTLIIVQSYGPPPPVPFVDLYQDMGFGCLTSTTLLEDLQVKTPGDLRCPYVMSKVKIKDAEFTQIFPFDRVSGSLSTYARFL